MPCSGLTGANLKEQSDFCPWYIGLPFIPYLDNLPNFNRSVDGPIRLPIVDKYKDMGTVVLGKLESGSISKGQQLVMMPNKHNVEVLGILSDDVETDSVAPGENLKIRLKGIEEEEILPGFILCDPNNLCHSGRTFDAQDMGTVVLGKLESGSISKGQQLVMMPNKHNVEVLGILSDDVETDSVAPGENLKIRLKGIEEEEILPGFILCDPNNLCHSGRTFDAQIVIIEHKSIICPKYNAVLHIHTCIEEVEITALICLVDKKSGEKSKTRPRFVKQDQVCIARLRTAGTICLETFKDFPQMGRFTLRDEGKTIAIGKVLKLVPEKD
ncbi:Eukaryotic peptide chain release factor GTP-binding subunit ERF3A [Tupaia chinensis]|uniref:Eukaryotic peptide chain release factor GTP-binding subunit ERF3A n=1 Tax=Tupaia chinensis TaxID=246437 RepID=L9KXJ2_TUPCH|nr:Eukaryotic peptide chain release factor GTP-binding subunit ERF3A [Tupaia chinensis]